MDKSQVARTLKEIAILLELKGENSFKIRAHENAARAVDGLAEDLALLVKEGRLTSVPGIGDSRPRKCRTRWTASAKPVTLRSRRGVVAARRGR